MVATSIYGFLLPTTSSHDNLKGEDAVPRRMEVSILCEQLSVSLFDASLPSTLPITHATATHSAFVLIKPTETNAAQHDAPQEVMDIAMSAAAMSAAHGRVSTYASTGKPPSSDGADDESGRGLLTKARQRLQRERETGMRDEKGSSNSTMGEVNDDELLLRAADQNQIKPFIRLLCTKRHSMLNLSFELAPMVVTSSVPVLQQIIETMMHEGLAVQRIISPPVEGSEPSTFTIQLQAKRSKLCFVAHKSSASDPSADIHKTSAEHPNKLSAELHHKKSIHDWANPNHGQAMGYEPHQAHTNRRMKKESQQPGRIVMEVMNMVCMEACIAV